MAMLLIPCITVLAIAVKVESFGEPGGIEWPNRGHLSSLGSPLVRVWPAGSKRAGPMAPANPRPVSESGVGRADADYFEKNTNNWLVTST
jgi:hypothetical protein